MSELLFPKYLSMLKARRKYHHPILGTHQCIVPYAFLLFMYGFFSQSNFCLAVSLGVKLQTLYGTVAPVSVLFAVLAMCSVDTEYNCVP